MEVLVATGNAHKLREIREILGRVSGVEFLSLHQFPGYTLPEETGQTFEENARLKAEHAAKALDLLVLADDSGLVVPSLEGRPGVYSARYAGPGATDRDNRRKLLEEMAVFEDDRRAAYFECVVALASPEGVLACESGRLEGEILREERGSQGFGYDPLFLKHDYRKTLAELDSETKNRISHRRRALDRIRASLENTIALK